uniref:Uncharacterized protein n=1 Tax=Cacopsylla melanoneura TaxID=428564 RepID=A0A8D8LHR9_9HEMI
MVLRRDPVLPSCLVLTPTSCTPTWSSPELRSETSSSPKVVTSTRYPTRLVPCLRVCSTDCSNTWLRNVTKPWTPNRSVNTLSEYWILPGSKSSISTDLNSFVSTLPMKNCNNFSTTICLCSSKKSTSARALNGLLLISAWTCRRVLI